MWLVLSWERQINNWPNFSQRKHFFVNLAKEQMPYFFLGSKHLAVEPDILKVLFRPIWDNKHFDFFHALIVIRLYDNQAIQPISVIETVRFLGYEGLESE